MLNIASVRKITYDLFGMDYKMTNFAPRMVGIVPVRAPHNRYSLGDETT